MTIREDLALLLFKQQYGNVLAEGVQPKIGDEWRNRADEVLELLGANEEWAVRSRTGNIDMRWNKEHAESAIGNGRHVVHRYVTEWRMP